MRKKKIILEVTDYQLSLLHVALANSYDEDVPTRCEAIDDLQEQIGDYTSYQG